MARPLPSPPLFTAFAAGEAFARIFGGPVVDRLGRVHTLRYTTALGVLGVVLFILGGIARQRFGRR